jgi:hypothetical protein
MTTGWGCADVCGKARLVPSRIAAAQVRGMLRAAREHTLCSGRATPFCAHVAREFPKWVLLDRVGGRDLPDNALSAAEAPEPRALARGSSSAEGGHTRLGGRVSHRQVAVVGGARGLRMAHGRDERVAESTLVRGRVEARFG